jgi:hypothetical protein
MPGWFRRLLSPASLITCALLAGALPAGTSAAPNRTGAFTARRAAPQESSGSLSPGEAPSTGEGGARERRRRRRGEREGLQTSSAEAPSEGRARPRRGGRGGRCRLSVQLSSPRVIAGEQVTLTGALLCPGAAIPTGGAVSVFERGRPHAAATRTEVGAAAIAGDGAFHLTTPALEHNSVFLVRLAGAHGARAAVKVAPSITLVGPTAGAQPTARGGARLRGSGRLAFSGTVTPAAAGTRVALQRRYTATGEPWRTVAFAHTDANGSFSVAHGFRTAGSVEVRAVARPPGDVAGTSNPLTYVIEQAQNPQLTIHASADPVSPGESLTISGVAAGWAGHQVTLLARTAGRPFTIASTTTADAGGAYSFTVAPLASTSYRAVAGAASATLFEGVRDVLTAALSTSGPGSPPSPAAGVGTEATIEVGEELVFSGTLTGAAAGQAVYLQRELPSGVQFHTVASTTVDATSAYAFTYAFDAPGTWVMRVKVPAGPQSLASASATFTIHVERPAPGP